MKTTIHTYRFDISKPEEKAEYLALRERLKDWPGGCFETWGGKELHYQPSWNGHEVELETAHLFSDQWNTAPGTLGSANGWRIMDWAQDYFPNGSQTIKQGYYIDQTPEMREIRRNTSVCGYCGKQEPSGKYVFCPHCLDNEYLKIDDLHLTRMRPVEEHMPERPPLTEPERSYLVPLYREAQLHGSTERGRARIAKARKDIEEKYQRAKAVAEEEHAAALWILERFPGLLANWIFYSHTRKHSFGWRKPLSEGEASALLDQISEFPFAYEIATEEGKKLTAV